MEFNLGDYQDIFLMEANEQLQELNESLLALEENPDNIELVNDLFRVAHTLKSSSAFVGLDKLSDLTHKMEDVLDKIRNKDTELTANVIDVLFMTFDIIKSVIVDIESGKTPQDDFIEIIDKLENIAGGTKKKSKKDEKQAPVIIELTDDDIAAMRNDLNEGKRACSVIVTLESNAQAKWVRAELVLNNLSGVANVIRTVPSQDKLQDEKVFKDSFGVLLTTDVEPEILYKKADVSLVKDIMISSMDVSIQKEESESDLSLEESEIGSAKKVSAAIKSMHGSDNQTVRVAISKLDNLMNLISEMVITNAGFSIIRDQLMQKYGRMSLITEFEARIEQMGRISKELQNAVQNARMLPIRQVFQRFPRIVRDLSHETNKEINLVMKGEETELDKKVIDTIGEPLLHMVKNAIDHGIESPDVRKKAGKPREGTINLNAYQEGNQIVVEISDDGRGLDRDKIIKKAIRNGVITADMASVMDDTDVYGLIFRPGFSTAEVVTEVSGRGVGMDVVQEKINELNGDIDIETELGVGTRFAIRLPLTMAIITTMLCTIDDDTYAIPLNLIHEFIKIDEDDIDTIEGEEVLNYRDGVIGIVRIDEVLGLVPDRQKREKLSMVIIGYGDKNIAIVVDRLIGIQEVVIKTLEQHYKAIEGISGAAILGDGKIAFIIDLMSLISSFYKKSKIAGAKQENQRVGSTLRKVDTIKKAVAESAGAENESAGSEQFEEEEDPPTDSSIDDDIDDIESEEIMFHEDVELEQSDLDAIASLGNMGMANAAIALSKITGSNIQLAIPNVEQRDVTSLIDIVGGSEQIIAGIVVSLENEIEGDVVFTLRKEDALRLVDMVSRQPIGTTTEINEENSSVLTEVTNIVASSFINTLVEKTGFIILPMVPMFAIDMAGAVMDTIINKYAMLTDKATIMETEFFHKNDKIIGNFFILLSGKLLKNIVDRVK